MDTLSTIFLTSFMIALSGAMMPGSLLTVTISESSRRGLIAGPLLMLGHSLLELALVVALLLGLAPLFNQPWFFLVVSLLGGGMLLWMAVGMLRALPSLSLELEAAAGGGRGNLVMTGALMSLANPYWIIWWATIGVGYIFSSRQAGLLGVLIFFVGHILADFAWYTLISTVIGTGRTLFTDRIYRGVIGVCAAFLAIFACFLWYHALQTLGMLS